ncbi:response regulator [Roseateles sp. DC23W]|uniref:Response regulator n=1 Tax=Pelomonas dachongensis TaxID=3299029 RepID=A0ABW7EMS3_9BURK
MDIFVVEDSVAIRRLLVRRLDAMPGLRVVGEAAGQRQAFALIQWTQPQVVLLDLSLASGSGFGLVSQLRDAGYSGRIAVLTAQDAEPYRSACMKAGADAFYDKGTGLNTLFDDLAGLAATRAGDLDGRPCMQLRDGLTGLHNKVALHERLDQASRCASRDGVDLAVYVVRLLGLTDLPADQADTIAIQVAERLRSVGSESDIVARSTRDQFAVVLTRLHQADQAAGHARDLAARMAPPFQLPGGERALNIEIGMALFPADAVSPHGLLTLAEASAFGAL